MMDCNNNDNGDNIATKSNPCSLMNKHVLFLSLLRNVESVKVVGVIIKKYYNHLYIII